MKNQNGVTLVYLITIILITIIIATLTTITSLSAFRQMKYETFKAELEEIQVAVNEICEDYELAKEADSTITDYNTYFSQRYEECPVAIEDSTDEEGVLEVIEIYGALSSDDDDIFYFDTSDIKTYFGLETTIGAVLVDFKTRYIYSVNGCQDPSNTDYIYYTLADANVSTGVSIGGNNIYEDTESAASSLIGVTVSDNNSSTLQIVGDTSLLEITLTAERDSTGKDYSIKKAYYSTDDGETYIEVDYLGNCVYTEDTVSFVIYSSGTYTFMLEDTYGTQVTTTGIYNDPLLEE